MSIFLKKLIFRLMRNDQLPLLNRFFFVNWHPALSCDKYANCDDLTIFLKCKVVTNIRGTEIKSPGFSLTSKDAVFALNGKDSMTAHDKSDFIIRMMMLTFKVLKQFIQVRGRI